MTFFSKQQHRKPTVSEHSCQDVFISSVQKSFYFSSLHAVKRGSDHVPRLAKATEADMACVLGRRFQNQDTASYVFSLIAEVPRDAPL